MGVGRAAEPEMLTRMFGGEIASRAAVAMDGGRDLCVERRRL